jgi:hypothetical protein
VELSKFGWWFASRKFEDKWALEQLRTVLDLTGMIDADFGVSEALAALAPQFPHECVWCIARMAQGERHDWTIYGNREHIQSILRVALASDNVDAKAAAERLVQFLVGRGHFEFRDLLT